MLGVALAVVVDAPFGGDRRAVHDKDRGSSGPTRSAAAPAGIRQAAGPSPEQGPGSCTPPAPHQETWGGDLTRLRWSNRLQLKIATVDQGFDLNAAQG